MKISYIVTTYNRQHLLERALDSICAERIPDSELLVVDDQGTVPAYIPGRVQEKFGGACSLLRPPANLGVIGARNHGLAHAQGAYILFLDDDDESLPNRTADLLEEMERTGADFIAAKSYFHNGHSVQLVPDAAGMMHTPETLLLSPSHIDAVIWNKSMLERQNGLDARVPYLGEHISLVICLLRGGSGRLSEAAVARFGYLEAGLTHQTQQAAFLQKQLSAMFETLKDESLGMPFYSTCDNILNGLQEQAIPTFDDYLALLPRWMAR